jgi:hypothetical protein
MALIDPICASFVLQMGPIMAMIDPKKGRKPPQKLIFVCKISGTSTKTRANRRFFNDFPVPLNTWDKRGTKVGQAMRRDTSDQSRICGRERFIS